MVKADNIKKELIRGNINTPEQELAFKNKLKIKEAFNVVQTLSRENRELKDKVSNAGKYLNTFEQN